MCSSALSLNQKVKRNKKRKYSENYISSAITMEKAERPFLLEVL